MATVPRDVPTPFRWSLVPREQLGTLVAGIDPPRLPDLDELVDCAAKTLARCGGGRLLFVGRSADSLFDLLSGVLAGTDHRDRLARLAYSVREDPAVMSADQIAQARAILAASGLSPEHLTGREPIALVDLVAGGRTFTGLFHLLREWAVEQDVPWEIARQRLRFVGITSRRPTSPKTWRWQQHVDWLEELPAGAVVNVSLDPDLWTYWAEQQPKLTRSLHPGQWNIPEQPGPRHDEAARAALAEAVALVDLGGRRTTRVAIARVLEREPAFAHHWLRLLAAQIRQPMDS
ncbi:MAG: hypothetical protein ACT4QF_05245 [Sporichthyaceae bacterium]